MTSTNDMDHMIKRVAVVADICTKMGNKPLMYRQVKGVVNNAHKFAVKVTPQENRKYNGNAKNPAQAKVIQALNIKNPVDAKMMLKSFLTRIKRAGLMRVTVTMK